MFFITFLSSISTKKLPFSSIIDKKPGAHYSGTTTPDFAATTNNFELAMAGTISVFGINFRAAFASVIGQLLEV